MDPVTIQERTELLRGMVEELTIERANERVGEKVVVLVEDDETNEGRAEHQGPEVDTTTTLQGRNKYRIGEYVEAVVSDVFGADLVARPL